MSKPSDNLPAAAEPAAPARAAVAAPPQPQMTPPVIAAASQPVVTRSPLAAATESDDEPEPQVVTPRIPTRASVAKQATITKWDTAYIASPVENDRATTNHIVR